MLDAKHKSSYVMGMNKLDTKTRAQILPMLVEGSSMRSISRVAGVSINTVTKLLDGRGTRLRRLPFTRPFGTSLSKRVQCDEIWSFCYAKEKNVDDGEGRAGWRWRRVDVDRDRRRQQADRVLHGRRPRRATLPTISWTM